jgi:hypothetical protein
MNHINNLKIFLFSVLFLCSVLLPINLYAENTNVGFVPSNIWYSKDPFSDGEKIKIYTLLFNQDSRELSGKLSFYNRDTLLGSKNFTLKSQESEVVALEWIVTAGTHTIYARITDAKFLVGSGKYEEINIAQNESEKSQKIVIKKIAPDIKKLESDIKEKVEESVGPIANIEDKIIENTPKVISKPVIAVTSSLDSLRLSGLDYTTNKKEEIQKEINELKAEQEIQNNNEQYKLVNGEKTEVKEPAQNATQEVAGGEGEKINENKSQVNKPLKYLSLFFFTVLSFILNNKIIFYITLIFLVFSILRFIWRKFT